MRILALIATFALSAIISSSSASAKPVSFQRGPLTCTPSSEDVAMEFATHANGIKGHLVYEGQGKVERYRFEASGKSTGVTKSVRGKRSYTLNFGKFQLVCGSTAGYGQGSCTKHATRNGYAGTCSGCGQADGRRGKCYVASYIITKER